MRRRKFIIASSALTFSLAGCSGGGVTAPAPAESNKTPKENDGPSTTGEQTTAEASGTETASTESGEQETEEPIQPEPSPVSGMADVVIDDTAAELGIDESRYSDEVYAAVDLTNVGDAVSGMVEVTGDFLDQNGGISAIGARVLLR